MSNGTLLIESKVEGKGRLFLCSSGLPFHHSTILLPVISLSPSFPYLWLYHSQEADRDTLFDMVTLRYSEARETLGGVLSEGRGRRDELLLKRALLPSTAAIAGQQIVGDDFTQI